MSAPFGFFCKSFIRDLDRFERLFQSLLEHDRDKGPLLLSVPESDRTAFMDRVGMRAEARGRLEIITDESLVGGAIRQSWRKQQIVKLHAWETGFAEAFMLVDSDFAFIRPFGHAEFSTGDGRTKFILTDHSHDYAPGNARVLDRLRSADPAAPLEGLAQSHPATPPRAWRRPSRLHVVKDKLREPDLQARRAELPALFGRPVGSGLECMPGPIWTRALLRGFRDDYLAPRRLSYADLIRYSPWEYAWVAEYALAVGLPGLAPAHPFFLHFSSDEAITHARAQGLTLADFGRHYLGVALASGHQSIEAY